MTIKLFSTILLNAVVITFLAGCGIKVPDEATWDAIFIGKWEGDHLNKDGGYILEWEKTRMIDGTYKLVLLYYNKYHRFLDSKVEEGKWWIYNDIYYEMLPSLMEVPQSYKYEILSEDKIRFTSTMIDSSSDEKIVYFPIEKRVQ